LASGHLRTILFYPQFILNQLHPLALNNNLQTLRMSFRFRRDKMWNICLRNIFATFSMYGLTKFVQQKNRNEFRNALCARIKGLPVLYVWLSDEKTGPKTSFKNYLKFIN
jgi:hypothetical protein